MENNLGTSELLIGVDSLGLTNTTGFESPSSAFTASLSSLIL
ncbi:hypothetical protein [Paenibacillus lutrae]|nr:hypothetical protein [Paenibacillus lutrae]